MLLAVSVTIMSYWYISGSQPAKKRTKKINVENFIIYIAVNQGSKVQVLDEELKRQTLTNCRCFYIKSELSELVFGIL